MQCAINIPLPALSLMARKRVIASLQVGRYWCIKRMSIVPNSSLWLVYSTNIEYHIYDTQNISTAVVSHVVPYIILYWFRIYWLLACLRALFQLLELQMNQLGRWKVCQLWRGGKQRNRVISIQVIVWDLWSRNRTIGDCLRIPPYPLLISYSVINIRVIDSSWIQ
jgi:hypothetical protein